MSIIDNVKKNIENYITKYLILRIKDNQQIDIQSPLSEKSSIIKNKIWYRAQPKEIQRIFNTLDFDDTAFWRQSSEVINFRKIHSGLPALITNTLSNIVISDFNGIDIDNDEYKAIWEEIEKDNMFYNSLYDTLTSVLSQGDGAIKIVYNPSISKYPILHFVEALNVSYKYEYKRLKEVIFRTDYKKNNKEYHLLEFYGYGYIKYRLFDNEKNEYPLSTIEELKDLQDLEFIQDKNLILAIPIKIWNSALFEDRGKSIFDGRDGAFDFVDETLSQLINALRQGTPKTYIPSLLLPRGENGEVYKSNDYVNSFIKLDSSRVLSEQAQASLKVETIEHNIQCEKYLLAYNTALEIALDGLISPSTLGLDAKHYKDQNAEAQREKEKITLYTRNAIIDSLSDCLKKIVYYSIKSYYTLNNKSIKDFDISVLFGEYSNPSFEAQVETIAKTFVNGKQFMSFEMIVNELYGDTLTEEEKAEEVERLNKLNNSETLELGDLFNEDMADEDINNINNSDSI